MILIAVLQAGGDLTSFIFPLLILVVFYFFFMRPQAQKQKRQAEFTNTLQKGDDVVTGSGLVGKVNKIDGGVITLQMDQKTFIRVVKGAISEEMTSGYKTERAKKDDDDK